MTKKEVMWYDVDIWKYDGSEAPFRLRSQSNAHVRALWEYRRTRGIEGHYLADPSKYDEDDESVVVAGPSVEEIDWRGIWYPEDWVELSPSKSCHSED